MCETLPRQAEEGPEEILPPLPCSGALTSPSRVIQQRRPVRASRSITLSAPHARFSPSHPHSVPVVTAERPDSSLSRRRGAKASGTSSGAHASRAGPLTRRVPPTARARAARFHVSPEVSRPPRRRARSPARTRRPGRETRGGSEGARRTSFHRRRRRRRRRGAAERPWPSRYRRKSFMNCRALRSDRPRRKDDETDEVFAAAREPDVPILPGIGTSKGPDLAREGRARERGGPAVQRNGLPQPASLPAGADGTLKLQSHRRSGAVLPQPGSTGQAAGARWGPHA